MSILDRIVAYKIDEVAAAKAAAPVEALAALARNYAPKGFKAALERKAASGYALIAEIKKASPSKGLIRADFDPAAHARAYAAGGAACLSVLTDGPSFQGSPDFLRAARGATTAPILRKDFIIDPYQIVEARAWGADCVLLIMACLSDAEARILKATADEFGLDALIEVHDFNELDRALRLKPDLIGVNNRNLNTFETDLETTRDIANAAPRDVFLVAESGIATHDDLVTLAGYGANGFLVGESLMRQADLEAATRRLLAPVRTA